MTTNETPRFSRAAFDPVEWMQTWPLPKWPGAPQFLQQPILPGWTFNINSNNSSSPETEADVVAKHSYGRQLGRISDALEVLIEDSQAKHPKDKRFSAFLTMKREIDKVKEDAAAARIKGIINDLAVLKVLDEEQFKRLRDGLRDALR
jgi:hypothetical protein